MKRGQVKVPAMDSKGNHGQCDVLDLDEQSFRIFMVQIFIKMRVVGYIDGNAPVIRNEASIPLTAKKGVSFALDKDKKP